MLKTEIWKKVKDYPYEVSSLGNVRRIKDSVYKGKKQDSIKPYLNNKGYKVVNFWVHSKLIHKQVHRLIAEAFIENKNNLPEINHIDGNPLNNSINNLEWCTHQYNMQHSWDTGLHKDYHSNASIKRKKSSSTYYGVHFNKSRNKWVASVGFNNRTNPIGRFNDEIEAAKAYDIFVIKNNLQKYGYKLNFS